MQTVEKSLFGTCPNMNALFCHHQLIRLLFKLWKLQIINNFKNYFSFQTIIRHVHFGFGQLLQLFYKEVGFCKVGGKDDAGLMPHEGAVLKRNLLWRRDEADILGACYTAEYQEYGDNKKSFNLSHKIQLQTTYLAVSRYEINAAAFSTTAITANTMNCVRMLSTVLPFKITVFIADMKNDIGLA